MSARFTTLAEWLQWQETLHPSTIDLGLSRIRQVATRLLGENFPTQQPFTITVGGTNGKGSCVTTLTALLHSLGKRVGSFTSPHLFRYNERIRIDGAEVSNADLCEAFAAIDAARAEISLTYFEFNALAAFWLFKKYRVDVQVLEVGLGGRLDAVNLLDADIAVITNIALDHVDWLGDTREKIGAEKAGILRANGKLVYGEVGMPASIQAICNDLQVDIKKIESDFGFVAQDENFRWQGIDAQNNAVTLHAKTPSLPLPSVACALQVLAWLEYWDEEKFSATLPNISLAGRMQKITWQGRQWILDVAHNEAGAQYLAQRLQQEDEIAVNLIFSAMADKDIAAVLAALKPVIAQCVLFPLQDNARAASLLQLREAALAAGIHSEKIICVDDEKKAITCTEQQVADMPMLVCGSFFTVAAVMDYLR
ncbi:MAG: bifunctional tetrahydrofolate synthase/dihydrofolate synthase [Pseudomonadales bacterium]